MIADSLSMPILLIAGSLSMSYLLHADSRSDVYKNEPEVSKVMLLLSEVVSLSMPYRQLIAGSL